MWTYDDFPGAKNVPWQLLIRARFVHEIDAVLASTIVRNLGGVASVSVTKTLIAAAEKALSDKRPTEVSAGQRAAAVIAVADWEELCPRPWPWPWPPRRHLVFDELSDPITTVLAERAIQLVKAAGSEALQKSLGGALAKMGGHGAMGAG